MQYRLIPLVFALSVFSFTAQPAFTYAQDPGANLAERLRNVPLDDLPDPAAFFDRFDANRDGRITLQEVPAIRQNAFRRILAHVGATESITKQQFVQAAEELKRQAGASGSARPTAPAIAAPTATYCQPVRRRGFLRRLCPFGRGRRLQGRLEEVFQQLDRNRDGRITRDETPARFLSRFDQLDLNRDGGVDRSELTQAAAQLRGR